MPFPWLRRETFWFKLVDRLLVVAVLMTAWRFLARPAAPRDAGPPIRPGARLELPGVAWQPGTEHLVLFLHTKCGFCRQSAPFYRELVARSSGHPAAQIVVASQEARPEVEAWLAENGIAPPGQVVQVKGAADQGLSLTPTLLFVAADGAVTDVLLGALSEKDRERVLARLAGDASAGRLDNTDPVDEIDAAALERLRAQGSVVVVDTRDRDAFRDAERRDGAVNIPLQELGSRAAAELVKREPTVIDCPAMPANRCRTAVRLVREQGFSRVMMLAASR